MSEQLKDGSDNNDIVSASVSDVPRYLRLFEKATSLLSILVASCERHQYYCDA